MSPHDPTVADALLDGLAAHGVEVCFGLPGVHNLPFWVGAGTGGRPRVVAVRHEQAAAYAADGLARRTGGLGVALTTTGPGFVNALAAFGEAWASFSPVLLVSSETPLAARRTRGADDGLLHGMRSQAEMVRAGFGAMAHSAVDGADAVSALPRLVAHSLATGRPTYLGVPSDVLASAYDGPPAEPVVVSLPEPGDDEVAALADLVRGRTVCLWVGARALAAEADLDRLARALGALVVPTYQARGLLASYAGTVQAPPHEPQVADAIAACDVLLVVGDDLHGMTTRNWRMPRPELVAAIVDDASLSLGDWPLAARVVGPVPETLGRLVALVESAVGSAPDAHALTTAVRSSYRDDPRAAEAVDMVEAVERSWPVDGALVLDMCVAGYWLAGQSHQPVARRLQYPVGWGTLGFGFPAAMGPAALGVPTLAVVGDGGFAMGVGEMATCAQEQLPLVMLVVDDGGYGMLRYDQQVDGHEERGVDLVAPDWERLASAYAWGYADARDAGDGLASALSAARVRAVDGQPQLVLLRARLFPPRTTSPRWREAH